MQPPSLDQELAVSKLTTRELESILAGQLDELDWVNAKDALVRLGVTAELKARWTESETEIIDRLNQEVEDLRDTVENAGSYDDGFDDGVKDGQSSRDDEVESLETQYEILKASTEEMAAELAERDRELQQRENELNKVEVENDSLRERVQ